MYARVTQLFIQPGKIEGFVEAARTVLPALRKQAGFRALVVTRSGEPDSTEVTAVSVWDSLDHLKASEKNMFLYQALSRVLGFAEGFPRIHEQEVLLGEFAAD